MGLVDYSDSEGSDAEVSPAPAPKTTTAAAKPAFPKGTDRSAPKKIKVELPSIKPEPGQPQQDGEQERPAKRVRTGGGGAFSGFNSLLPAPKGRVQSGPKPGVSLKTSSEAAFSRAPVDGGSAMGITEGSAPGMSGEDGIGASKQEGTEPKLVGKATKFKPLSVANHKKKTIKKPKPPENAMKESMLAHTPADGLAKNDMPTTDSPAPLAAPAPTPPKPKRSLFSVPAEDEPDPEPEHNGNSYKSMTTTPATPSAPTTQTQSQPIPHPPPPGANSLSTLASDLNLTPAQRRQLFGRGNASKDADINIAHFNMDSEYASNEAARQNGEVIEHRAVKAIAPGKHSLQQLVNNARTQQGAMEDKWAEGRRERGEAGGKYGWGGK